MLVLVPLICFELLVLTMYAAALPQRSAKPEAGSEPVSAPSWRHAFMSAAVIFGVLLAASTEILSLFGVLTREGIAWTWVAGVVVAGAACVYLLRNRRPSFDLLGLPRPSWFLLACIAAFTVIVATLAVVAAFAPPNNWDGMTYHLPRVMHWIQDHGLADYPTSNMRQLYSSPWDEFAVLHLYLLSGGDLFTNLVQWSALVGGCVGASAIAKQLGSDGRGQGLALVFAVSLPMGILQSTSPQNDLTAAFWLVCFAYHLLVYMARPNRISALAVGASLGLALLTKATAYFFVAPFLLWLGIWAIRTRRREVWKAVLAVAVIALALNAGIYARNLTLFNTPLNPESQAYALQVHTPSAVACSVTKEASLNLGTPFPAFNDALLHSASGLCTVLGTSVNEPGTNFRAISFAINAVNTQENTAGNPIQLILLLAACAIALLTATRRQITVMCYVAAIAGGFLLYCILLRWQPWGSRLLLPLFFLAAPFCGVVLSRVRGATFVTSSLTVLLLLSSVPYVLQNQYRPLLGNGSVLTTPRIDQYFNRAPFLEQPSREAAAFVQSRGCTQVGFAANEEGWEYPFWVLLATDRPDVRIEQVDVQNPSAALAQAEPYGSFHPCAIIAMQQFDGTFVPAGDVAKQSAVTMAGQTYTRPWVSGLVAVFIPSVGG